ncbi:MULTISPECIES: DUF2905 domain-containing protein [Cohnella]|uniref:DUF2905 domain-containing protein n=1 Tax=Cohnella TaxID=329857 RepID=UPI0009B9D679|nr:DUF2905 domain-containing protein [Cohnella massiliensis]MBN2983917.1 DUF2905 domain-containing protein [Cohnella algarum]
MNSMPKLLIGAGVLLIVVGLIWMVAGRYLNLGRLPGDLSFEKGNVRFYFPIVTCILISVILSAIAYVIRLFTKS